MFRNNLKFGLRNLAKNKLQTFTNVIGLTIGITGAIVTFITLQHELSFDQFHSQSANIYRVNQHNESANGMAYWNTTAYPLAAALREDFSGINVTQSAGPFNRIISAEKQDGSVIRFDQSNIIFADKYYLQLFDFSKHFEDGLWVAGDAETAFEQLNSVIISEKIAARYFPKALQNKQSLIGEKLLLNNKEELTVAGVIKNPPANTSLYFDILINYEFFKTNNRYQSENWSGNYWGTTYVTLKNGQAPSEMEQQIKAWQAKYLNEEDNKRIDYILQPLDDLHINTLYDNTTASYSISKNMLWGIGWMSLFLIIIACFNFINLTTARMTRRFKEVGIRKILGSSRQSLIAQFLCEALVLTSIAAGFSIIASEFILGWLNQVFSDFRLALDMHNLVYLFTLGLIGIVTLLAGLYPAFVISKFTPLETVKSNTSQTGKNSFPIRNALVILQFGIAHLLIVGALITAYQMNYFNNQKLGFSKEAIIRVNIPNQNPEKLTAFANEIKRHANIENLSFATGNPMTNHNQNYGTDVRLEHEPQSAVRLSEMKVVDLNYLELFDLELLTGKPLTESNVQARRFNGFVANETLVKSLNLTPETALGQIVAINEGEAPIIGVVKDFHNNVLKDKISPCLIFYWGSGFFGDAFIKLKTPDGNAVNMGETLSYIDEIWATHFPESIYQYEFLDQALANNYKVEAIASNAFQLFSILALVICAMGLFGLITFMAETRTKEIGIRKVLGASVLGIITLLSKDFVRLIMVALIITTPLALLLMTQWLQNYAYHIELQWWHFILAALPAILITVITVSFQSGRAAKVNPIQSLRN